MQENINNQLEKYIQECVLKHYQNKSINIFDELMEKCRLYYEKPAHSIKEIKDKMNTKIKGDIFEHFCVLYLRTSEQFKFQDVWLLGDVPQESMQKLGLKRYDLGIDIIARDRSDRYYAIQAKYRKRNLKKMKVGLTWKQLSTFYGLVSRTGPFLKHIVMTNADFCRHVGKRSTKDRSICYTTFRNTKIEHWRQMSNFQEHSMSLPSSEPNLEVPVVKPPKIIIKKKIETKILSDDESPPDSIDELRYRRLKFFNQIASQYNDKQ